MLERAYVQLLMRGGNPEHAEEVLSARRAFEKRTGSFAVEDAWFEARSAAFWDDALVRGFATKLATPDEMDGARAIERAHRGLYRVARGSSILECIVTGAAFTIDPPSSPGLAEALSRVDGFIQGFVAGALEPRTVMLLPGAIFHASEATKAIESLAASASDLDVDVLLDALLRMDRTLRAMPRPKAQLAYRPEALRPH